MSEFVTLVTNLVMEERTLILHDDMTLARLMLYDQSIDQSKLGRIARNLKRNGSRDEDKTRLKNRAQGQQEPRSAKM